MRNGYSYGVRTIASWMIVVIVSEVNSWRRRSNQPPATKLVHAQEIRAETGCLQLTPQHNVMQLRQAHAVHFHAGLFQIAMRCPRGIICTSQIGRTFALVFYFSL